jgi:hypothetical protein
MPENETDIKGMTPHSDSTTFVPRTNKGEVSPSAKPCGLDLPPLLGACRPQTPGQPLILKPLRD